MLSNSQATFLGFVVEAICYGERRSSKAVEYHSLTAFLGIYTVLFTMSIAFMTWRRKTKSLSTVLLLATCVLFLCATVHFALEFDNAYRTLVRNVHRLPERGTTAP